ncbi:MAG: type I-E CRISPR-associated protein Cas5/CasD [Alkalispirochaeta sp.]
MKGLFFRVVGPIVAWGKPAVGERRETRSIPTRSGTLGIIAAALGYTQSMNPEHLTLGKQYYVASQVLVDSGLLVDYHTTEAGQTSGKLSYRTRNDELFQAQETHTILSSREYRTDYVAVLAIIPKLDSPDPSLDVIKAALRRPTIAPFLGRKAAPPAAPFDPQLIERDTLMEAFEEYVHRPLLKDRGSEETGLNAWRSVQQLFGVSKWERSIAYAWDHGLFPVFAKGDDRAERVVVRAVVDDPTDRVRWQFAERLEAYLYDSPEEESA